MNMDFIRKLPIPNDLKKQFPLKQEWIDLKAKRFFPASPIKSC
mgnify:CR=1 FL=1